MRSVQISGIIHKIYQLSFKECDFDEMIDKNTHFIAHGLMSSQGK